MKDRAPLIAAYDSDEVQAFLWALRYGEGTQAPDGFQIMFGGERFTDFSDHPRRAITKGMKGKTYTSTAAGAWQFLARTWDGLVREYGFEDFSPRMQTLGAIALIRGRGALADVLEGRVEEAVRKCAREWASLPGSPYGQPVVTMAEFMREYEEGLKVFSGVAWDELESPPLVPSSPPPEPVPVQSPPTKPTLTMKEKIVNPFVTALLPALIDLVPKLGKIFGSGSQVSERNIKAAETVAQLAKEVVGARNEQELLDMISTDPEAAAAVKDAVERSWFKLEEVGGGIEAARASGERYSMPGGPDFRRNPAFWISLIFLLMPIMILVDMLFLNAPVYDVSLRTQIITAILGLLSIVGAFWLGTNFTAQKKEDQGGKP